MSEAEVLAAALHTIFLAVGKTMGRSEVRTVIVNPTQLRYRRG